MYLVWVRGAFLAWFPLHHPLHPHHRLRTNVDSGKGIKESKNIQDPQNHGNDHDAVQDRFDGSLHGNEAIHQPQEDTHHDENFEQLN
jgi:hypothetical protein